MSFDQLPDELVALVASKCDALDLPNLLQTQKRVHHVMKQYRIDRPAVEYMTISFKRNMFRSIHAVCFVNCENSKHCECVRQEELLYSSEKFILKCIKKFRFISKLSIRCSSPDVCKLDEEFLWILRMAEKKVKTIILQEITVNLTTQCFLYFCQNLEELEIIDCRIDAKLLSDETLCKILPTTKFEFYSHYTFGHAQLNLTDTTIDAMINRKSPSTNFQLNRAKTNFSIAGIRRFVEHNCNRTGYYLIDFGILSRDQAAEASRWYNMVQQNPALPFKIEIYETDRAIQLNIWRRNDKELSLVKFEIEVL